MTKFCKDCKHFCPRWQSPPSCTNAVIGTDIVYGTQEWRECSQERLESLNNRCGPEGKNFEPRKPLTEPPTSETIETIKAGYQRFKTFWK